MMKCPVCGNEMFEVEFKDYDYNLVEGTILMLISVECEECEHRERKEIQGKITKVL